MRAPALACLACLAAALPAAAEEPKIVKEATPLVLTLPADTNSCLATMEAVLQRALETDLLDDQIDEAETHLDKLEAACHDGKFPEALERAKAVEKILATNK